MTYDDKWRCLSCKWKGTALETNLIHEGARWGEHACPKCDATVVPLSRNDELLIEAAYKVKQWNYPDVYTMVEDADTEDTKKTLRNIAGMLWDHNQDGRI